MPDPFSDRPFSDVLLQGVQVLLQARQAAQQLQLQRDALDLRRKDQDSLMSMREERLRLQEEALELRRQMAETKAAASTDQSPAAKETERKTAKAQAELDAVVDLSDKLPSNLQPYKDMDLETIDRHLEHTRTLLAARSDYESIRQEDMATKQSKPGPLTALRMLEADQLAYKSLLVQTQNARLREHPRREILFGPGAKFESKPEPSPAVSRTELDETLETMQKTGFLDRRHLKTKAMAYAKDLIRAGQRQKLYELLALLKTNDVPEDLQREIIDALNKGE